MVAYPHHIESMPDRVIWARNYKQRLKFHYWKIIGKENEKTAIEVLLLRFLVTPTGFKPVTF